MKESIIRLQRSSLINSSDPNMSHIIRNRRSQELYKDDFYLPQCNKSEVYDSDYDKKDASFSDSYLSDIAW